jgi:predicted phosphodiesterase
MGMLVGVDMMKVAVFSDVQGNLPAMEVAVEHILAWDPDLVIMDGDLINRGPSSAACLDLFEGLRRGRGWLPVLGNHEVWILQCAQSRPATPLEADMRRFADWTLAQIGERARTLSTWPDHLTLHAPGDSAWVHVTHGTLAGNRDGVSASVPDQALGGKVPEDLALFVTAHTHKPLERQFGATCIVNVGSVGSPFDGDPRGSYAQLEHRGGRWHSRIVRFDYDRERTERDFHASGMLEDGGPLARILFEEWRRARGLMSQWRSGHEPAVLTGARSLGGTVDAFLAGLGQH